jgi:hypothetical protein
MLCHGTPPLRIFSGPSKDIQLIRTFPYKTSSLVIYLKILTSILDKVASEVEGLGLAGLASEIDVIANTLEASSNVVLWGVLLDNMSKDRLLKSFEREIPKGWSIYAHHMTIYYGKLKDGTFKTFYDMNKGKKVTLQAVSWGISDLAMAVKLQTSVPSFSGVPHITIAVSPSGSPKDSKLIQDWKPLSSPLELTGVVTDLYSV